MKKQEMKNKIIYLILSGILFSVLFFLTFSDGSVTGGQSFDIVLFGDSVAGLVRDETGIAGQIGSLTQMTVYNAAMGGTCISRLDTENRTDYGKDSLSLVALSKAMASRQFGPQRNARMREPMTEYFEETVNGLEELDLSCTKVVLIEHGLNDFYAGVALENSENPMDEYTFAGALRSSIVSLKTAYPDVRIVVLTPTFTWLTVEKTGCDQYDVGYGNLEAYVQTEIAVAEELDVEIIDLYHDFFPHEHFEDYSLYTTDGLHPNEAGRKKIAMRVANYLNGGE